ncbi:MAG: lysophospholipase [Actinomycetota bacterium]|nr:lysophospholipase [Actinomycetota bacterium]
MKQVVVVVLVVMGVFLILIWTWQARLIYFPSPGPVPKAQTVIDGGRDVTLETSDGFDLGAWFVPGRDSNGFTVLVANGNAGDRSLRAPLAQALAGKGFNVLLFDYRGFGGNPGHPNQDGLALDARAAYRFLVEDEGIRPERLIYFGESLGAAVVAELATEHPPGGLVLRSPFTDLAAVGAVHYPWLPVRLLLRDRYPVVDYIERVNVPTAVVYGTEDEIVPAQQSREVAEAAGGQTSIIEVRGARHNDLALLNGAALIEAIVELADQIES